jgi:hypothetical protein
MGRDIYDIYDEKHWEVLVGTIIDRIGVEAFLDTTAYVLRQKQEQHAPASEHLGAVANGVEALTMLVHP